MNEYEATAQDRIVQILALIPAGVATSYGQIAELAGLPGRARLVARVLAQLPEGSTIPWQRVLRSDRRPAFAIGSASWQRQVSALALEGVVLANGRVPLAQWWPQCLETSERTASIARSKFSKSATARKSSR